MITISAIKENETIAPSRVLTDEEKDTITSSIFDGIKYIFYQGDEPIIIQEDEN